MKTRFEIKDDSPKERIVVFYLYKDSCGDINLMADSNEGTYTLLSIRNESGELWLVPSIKIKGLAIDNTGRLILEDD